MDIFIYFYLKIKSLKPKFSTCIKIAESALGGKENFKKIGQKGNLYII